jgi:ribosome maturation factor RimP
MPELEEFTDSLFAQLDVELNEEKEIKQLVNKIKDDTDFTIKFDSLEDVSNQIFPQLKQKISEFMEIDVSPKVKISYASLDEFKNLKGRKVFAAENARSFVDELFDGVITNDKEKVASLIQNDYAKYFVYSTYAIQYLSKLSTTYGDYLDDTIFLNEFILSSYPQIILYNQGKPFEPKLIQTKSGYYGALKMTVLEEMIHSVQNNLQEINKNAAMNVNAINEELAKIILNLDDENVSKLSDYLQLQPVPDDFPIAKRANLFFTLNPDNFIVNVLGPDVMTFTKVEIDPKIAEMIPQLLDIYQRWLKPIQSHHAAFTTMEGMAEFAVQSILKDDTDFQNYLTTFAGTDFSSYQVRKSLGKDFTQAIYEKFGKKTFKTLIDNPPTTKELKDSQLYLKRIS